MTSTWNAGSTEPHRIIAGEDLTQSQWHCVRQQGGLGRLCLGEEGDRPWGVIQNTPGLYEDCSVVIHGFSNIVMGEPGEANELVGPLSDGRFGPSSDSPMAKLSRDVITGEIVLAYVDMFAGEGGGGGGNIVQNSITADDDSTKLQDFGGAVQIWANMDDVSVHSVTGGLNSAGNGVMHWDATRTLNFGAYLTGQKTEGVVGDATQLLGTTANGDVVQVGLSGGIGEGQGLITQEWRFQLTDDLAVGDEVTLAQLSGVNGTGGNAPTEDWATDNAIEVIAAGIYCNRSGNQDSDVIAIGTATGLSFTRLVAKGNSVILRRQFIN